MRLDAASPRTWLLAAVAGWALLGWMLALGGMGGRLEPLPADPGLLPPLQPLQPAPPPRLQAYEQYQVIAERPLFAEDRRPHPFFLQGAGEATEDNAFNYVLTSVLLTPKLRMAILQPPDGGRSVRVRLDEAPETHPSWRLIELDERSAVFAGPEGERTMELRVYDGVGGPPPTRTAMDTPQPGIDPRIPIAPPEPTPDRRPSAPPEPKPDQPQPEAPQVEPDPADAPDPTESRPSPPMTEEAQMDAIRQRIQARREQLRRQQSEQPPDENR